MAKGNGKNSKDKKNKAAAAPAAAAPAPEEKEEKAPAITGPTVRVIKNGSLQMEIGILANEKEAEQGAIAKVKLTAPNFAGEMIELHPGEWEKV